MRSVLLIAVFLLLCGLSFLYSNEVAFAISGRLSLSLMFLFSGFLHLNYREGVYLSYPNFLPQVFKIKLVYAISDLQFAFAAALVFADVAKIAVPIILFYLIFGMFTIVSAANKKISIKRGNYTGNGLVYLIFKIPEQVFIIAWAYYFVLVC